MIKTSGKEVYNNLYKCENVIKTKNTPRSPVQCLIPVCVTSRTPELANPATNAEGSFMISLYQYSPSLIAKNLHKPSYSPANKQLKLGFVVSESIPRKTNQPYI